MTINHFELFRFSLW